MLEVHQLVSPETGKSGWYVVDGRTGEMSRPFKSEKKAREFMNEVHNTVKGFFNV